MSAGFFMLGNTCSERLNHVRIGHTSGWKSGEFAAGDWFDETDQILNEKRVLQIACLHFVGIPCKHCRP